MHYFSGKNLFEEFSAKRESLIFQYKKGDLNKKEYIYESYGLLQHLNAKPFTNVDNFEKAVFNYHFHNTMAKHAHMRADLYKRNGKHQELFRQFIKEKDRHYHQKDRMTWKAVSLQNFTGVEAYHVKAESTYLKENLLEIIFHNYPTVVCHSTRRWLRERLI